MKEDKLILMQKKTEQLTTVVNGLIQKLQQVKYMLTTKRSVGMKKFYLDGS